jgi:hypothetical protein
MRTVNITYEGGTVVDAVLLSRQGDKLRAAIRGDCNETREFTRVKDRWISEQCELVVIEFEWQRNPAAKVPTEEDCICSKELAAKLIARLQAGAPTDEIAATKGHVSSRGARALKPVPSISSHPIDVS